MTHSPAHSSLGSWQYKDSINAQIWTFDTSTKIWKNISTGYQWQFSDITPPVWTDSHDGTFWKYNENTGTWEQNVHEQE